MSEKIWSLNGEDFSYVELCDLLDCNDELKPGDVVYCGDPEPYDPGNWIDADDVIDRIGDAGYQEGGEHAEDYLVHGVEKEAKIELENFLEAWARKHCQPSFYGVGNVQKYTLTADDFAVFPAADAGAAQERA